MCTCGVFRRVRSSRQSACLEFFSRASLWKRKAFLEMLLIFAASRRLRQVKFAVWTGRVSERKILLQEA
jgi:hypothetical protein